MSEEQNKKSLKETANEYEPKFKKIQDIEKIPVDVDVTTRTETIKSGEKAGEEFEIKEIEVDGIKVRIPDSVISQLKTQLTEKEFDFFKVAVEGSGMNTKYTVITL